MVLNYIRYLNECWETIGHASPVCVFQLLATVGLAMLPDHDLVLSARRDAFLDVYWERALAYAGQAFDEIVKNGLEVLNHDCTGETLTMLRLNPVTPLFDIGYEQATMATEQSLEVASMDGASV